MSRSPSRSRSPSPTRRLSPVKRRDGTPEESACPFLIRIFITKGRHTPMQEFDEGNFPLHDEFQLYGWKHSTPTSLIQLLLPTFPAPYRSPQARFSFRHIYVDASQRGLYRSKDLVNFSGRELMSTISAGLANGKTSGMDMELDDVPETKPGRKVDEKTLDGYGFITGDLLSVSLHVPEPKVPPPGVSKAGPAGERGRFASGTGPGVSSVGWEEGRQRERNGSWSRGGGPLPPQNFTGRASLGGEPAGGGSWRGGAPGMGIRGAGRRSRSPVDRRESNGFRNRERERERERERSRSPHRDGRRESWSRRRD